MKPYWTFTKTALALVSAGILLAPALRRLGYLPPEPLAETSADEDAVEETPGSRVVAPPELSVANGDSNEFSFPRH